MALCRHWRWGWGLCKGRYWAGSSGILSPPATASLWSSLWTPPSRMSTELLATLFCSGGDSGLSCVLFSLYLPTTDYCFPKWSWSRCAGARMRRSSLVSTCYRFGNPATILPIPGKRPAAAPVVRGFCMAPASQSIPDRHLAGQILHPCAPLGPREPQVRAVEPHTLHF